MILYQIVIFFFLGTFLVLPGESNHPGDTVIPPKHLN